MRPSGRAPDQMRAITIEPRFTRHAEGSVLIGFGDTKVLVTASVEERLPPWLRGKGEGWVTAEYGMLPRATHTRGNREAAKGKQSGRTQEIQRLIGRSLRAVTDLKALGMLDSTLIVWHAEFGRMPISQRGVGRDHNPGVMTGWMAGAGIQGGQVIGASDEFGYKAEEQPVSPHDMHATMLHLLGMDHKQLTYRYNGRDMRLTDVAGTLIPQIVA